MTIAGLYGALQPSSSAPVYPSALLPSTVTAIPSRYQLQAVAWMVDREGRAVDVDDPCCARFNVASPDGLHDSVWFDRVTGRFAVDPPARVRAPCGGILADEMGLGKSLETLLLISARRRDPGECGRVLLSPWDGRPVTTCATTLIVAPRSLLAQWRCELERHCPHLSSLTYLSSSSSVTAKDMSSVDVVLTSFDVLRQEVHYSKAVPYGLRGEKVHRIPTTPLLELQFHRLVCDEAQQVDNTVTGAAQMALRIEARARWCVTGTPLGRHGLDDFRALFTMIAYDPFQAAGAFSTLLLAPWYAGDPRPMLAAVGAVFWRNSKASVARELHLPPLTTTDVRLSFNTVEAECYRRLRAETRTLVMDDDRRGALPYGNKDEDVFLHRRLEQLRQACCHPQVQNGHSGFDTCRGHRMMSMDQISETLCRAAQDDVSGAERDLCRALNRLGALHIAAGDDRRAWSALAQAWRIAESGYEHATSSSEFALVPTESIVTANSQHRAWQQVLIVTLTLLDGVATRLLASDEAAADDPDLVSSADLVARQRKTTLDEHLVVLLERVRDIRDLIGDYVGSVLDLHMPACGADARRLAERIRREAPALSPDLLDAAVTLQGRLAAERNAIDVRLRAQRLHDVNELIGLCEGPAGRLKQRCLAELCGPSVVGTSSRLSFRSLLVRERASLLKSLGDNADPVATRDDCLALTAQRVQVDSGLLITKIAREVEKQRGRLDEAERALDDERRCIAGWCAIPDTSAEADRSRLLAQVSNLRVTCQRALSHVRYLRYRFSAGGHETTCAICLAVADQPVITVCFHLFCRNCIVNILDRKGNGKCPSCRHALSTTTMYTVVSHADDRQSGAAAAPSPSEAAMLSQEMVGAQQFSTKIGAVVRSILWACRQSPGAKVLVFSQFRPILSIVSRALAANGVEHRHLDGNLRERASALELFQDPGSRVRALLMSLRHDASGLTLHAAQYVVLVEPSLNPAIEDQAISRVHRRGQTRSTFVYRFLVDRSIEEKIIEIQRHRRELMRRQQDEGDGAPDSVPARVAMREHVSMPELLRCLDDDT
ncbi:hypothetical protein PBRA_008277 [Plasmodiophora brassicae]|nr:hypothetical protein PBRA_008277 [Plasmodiophora brassicae]